MKVALDGIINLTDGVTKLIDTFGALPTLATAFSAGLSLFKNKGVFTFDKDTESIKLFSTELTGLGDTYKSLQSQIAAYNASSTKSLDGLSGSLSKYLSGLNGAKASVGGYVASLIGAKVATFALQVATVALNAAITMGISALISLGVKKLDEWIVTADELAEKVEEVTSKYKDQHDSLVKLKGDYDTSKEDSLISKYGELSKGVNSLGENISLTSDEYAEYQSIVDTIANQFPSLVTGYNSQGDAILSCAGSVDKLAESYRSLIKEQNSDVLKNGKDIFKDFDNDIRSTLPTSLRHADINGIGHFGKLNKLLGLNGEDLSSYVENNLNTLDARLISEMLDKNGIKRDVMFGDGLTDTSYESYAQHVERAIKEDVNKVKSILDEASIDINAYAEDLGTVTEAYFSTAFLGGDGADIGDFSHMSERMQNVINQITSGFNSEFYAQFLDDENPFESLTKYYDSMLTTIDNLNAKDAEKFEAAFELKTKFNGGDISYGDYVKGIKDVENLIDSLDLDQEVKDGIKLTLNTDEITKNYDALKERLTSDEYNIKMKSDEAEEFLNSLTSSEYSVAVGLMLDGEVDLGKFDIKSLRDYIEKEAKLQEALNFSTSIEVDKTALELLNTALEESASAMGLTEESIDSLKSKYSELKGYNPHTLFEKTANGVKLNRDEVAKLEKEYNDLKKTEVKEHLDTLVEEYNKCTKAIDGNIGSNEKLELISKREKYAEQIEELAEYQSQLEGVTGAYQRWIDAQNTPEDYEGYQNVATSREDIKDEIKRGFISNSTKEYIDLLSGEDLVGGTIDDYAEAWERLDKKVGSTSYSIHDFFTVNDDGDITSTGIDRFFAGIRKDFDGEVYKLNKETGEYYYDFSQENLKAIQDEWGIGIEAIELLLEAAAAAGYDIDWGGIFDDLDIDMSNFESVEAMISLAEKAQEEFNKIKNLDDVEFNFRTNNIQDATAEVEKARKAYVDLITNDDGSINLKAEGAEQMQFMLATLLTQKQQLSTPAIMKVDTSQIDKAETDIIDVINKAKELQTAYENYEIAITTGVDVDGAKKDLNSAIEGMKGTSVDVRADLKLPTDEELQTAKDSIGDIKVGATLDGTAIGNLATKIQTECTPEVIAKVTGLDESAVASEPHQVVYTAEHKDVDNFINSLTDISKKIIYSYTTEGTKPDPSNINRKITYTYEVEGEGPGGASGTAFANGSTSGRAFIRGNWGIKGNGTALGGELAPELLVREGKWHLIGENGAEFFDYKKNDIIFNAEQTRQLFKYGGIKGAKPRGKMFASGSAFAEGSYPSSGEAFWRASASTSDFVSARLKDGTVKKKPSVKTTTKKKDDSVTTTTTASWDATASESDFANNKEVSPESSKSSASKDKFEESFDWIEVAISRIERAIDKLSQKANNVYKSWSSRNKALTEEIAKVREEIELQDKAADRYLQEANSVGLSSSWVEKVRNGEVDLDTITDEKLAEKIKKYQEWYNKYLDCIDAAEELKETEASLYAQRFEHVQTQYDAILQGYEHTEAMLNEYISQAEAKGHIISKKYYEALIANEKSSIAELKKEQAELIAERDNAVAEGKITRGSEAWLEQCAAIDEVTQAIEESNTAILEYSNSIRDIDWEIFDLVQERISAVSEEADFLIELMSNKKLFEDDGKLTSQGLATMALHAQNYNSHMFAADEYGAEIADLNTQIAEDPYNQDLIDRRNELLELQRESILAAEDEKNAIKDLVEESINLELDALQELIDKKNEALESERDLYEYQKKVKEQTEEIASLEKQLAAYSGDDSEEAKQKIQQIKVDLETARQDLEETEYDKFISDTSAMLDTLYTEYELILNQRLDNIDALLESVIESINIAASADGTIATALGSEGALAIAVSNNATSIKDTLESEAKNVGITLSNAMNDIWSVGEGNAKSVLTMYGNNFQDKLTTTNAVLNDIKADIAAMVDDVDKDAQKKATENKTSTSAKKDPTKDSSSEKKTLAKEDKKSTSSGDGKPKVGDKVKFVNGKYYYDSQGKKPLGSKNRGKEVYITSINTKSWATHPYHVSTGKKLGSGDLGWLKLDQLSGYVTGKYNFSNDELAWTQEGNKEEYIIRPSDGAILTPVARKGSVLNAQASSNIWNMANSPAEFIKDNLNLGVTNVPNNSNVQSNCTQNFDKVVFNLPNVKNYDELLSAMQKDRNFEKLISSMTIDRINGKSSLAKGKSIR